MIPLQHVLDHLESLAPSSLAESWDNVGLLVGNRERQVAQVMTCLTITPASAAEAIAAGADAIVTHHPLPFKPLARLTTDQTPGRLLLDLMAARIAVISHHTAFDSAAEGINARWAAGLGLKDVTPLQPGALGALGGGRVGMLPAPQSLAQTADCVRRFLNIAGLHQVGSDSRTVQRVAIACGSAGSFLPLAIAAKCDLFITGETSFHTCLEAEAADIALLLPGHFASERFGVEALADLLRAAFPALRVWASQAERDPLVWKA